MRYSITFLEEEFARLRGVLFPADEERAAYLLCGLSVGPSETKLLVREVAAVPRGDVTAASRTHISIPANTFLRWLKRANEQQSCIVFVHSHPDDVKDYSPQDDCEEPPFFRTAHLRIHKANGVHGSLVLTERGSVKGRAWLPDGTAHKFDTVRIIGNRFRFIRENTSNEQLEYFDRQARAFGKDFQPILGPLRVAVVGAGGTGSSVCEQLIRLGVVHLTVMDEGRFEASNVNRVYGSYTTDDTLPKPQIVRRLGNSIGLGTTVQTVNKSITFQSAIQHLKDCDIIFGCTDDQWGRSLLTTFALHYLTPVFDMGVAIDATEDGVIERIEGRVTTLIPGGACLYCRKRINVDVIRAESMAALNPEEAQQLRHEGYIVGLPETAPSVVPFTTTIAAAAVQELLHRLTGFMGPDRLSSEIIHRFDWNRVRTNSIPSDSACACADRTQWGIGDVRPMLGVTWRPET